MKDKEKQIEEMARAIRTTLLFNKNATAEEMATDIYKSIFGNAVVLTREEYGRLKLPQRLESTVLAESKERRLGNGKKENPIN